MSVIQVKSVEEFKTILKDNRFVIVDFFATWCGPCKAIAPHIARWAAQYSVEGKVAFVKVDVDDLPDISSEYGVTAMPTFLFLENGEPSNNHAKIIGAVPPKLEAAIKEIAAAAA